jgi:hypothetical protein
MLLMDLQMLLEVAATGKRLGAVVTDEGLLTGVYPLMPHKIGHLAEGLVAASNITCIWSLFIVYSFVLLK